MRDNDLFQLALGVTSPWFVASSNFDTDNRRLDIRIDFKAGSRFEELCRNLGDGLIRRRFVSAQSLRCRQRI